MKIVLKVPLAALTSWREDGVISIPTHFSDEQIMIIAIIDEAEFKSCEKKDDSLLFYRRFFRPPRGDKGDSL